MKEKYLPIGTVCILNGGEKKVMITGFCATPTEDNTKVFDYSGCMYPEGFLVSNQACLFNHDQIKNIYHTGYQDQEDIEFKLKLKQMVDNINK